MAKHDFNSPLRYPGGKAKLFPLVKQIIYDNGLVGSNYLELYAGGSGLALSLLFNELVANIEINDLDRSIYAFWKSVIHNNEKFIEAIERIPVTMESWNAQKNIQKNKKTASLFQLGVSTFFLNRTNVSGILKGGVIGGRGQKGKYKINARFNKKELLGRLEKIGKFSDRIRVSNKDAMEILSANLASKLVYLDPPYVKKSKALYMNTYDMSDHQAIARKLAKDSGFLWILSYDKDPLIDQLYRSSKNKIIHKMAYGTSNKIGSEQIYFHPKLIIKPAALHGL